VDGLLHHTCFVSLRLLFVNRFMLAGPWVFDDDWWCEWYCSVRNGPRRRWFRPATTRTVAARYEWRARETLSKSTSSVATRLLQRSLLAQPTPSDSLKYVAGKQYCFSVEGRPPVCLCSILDYACDSPTQTFMPKLHFWLRGSAAISSHIRIVAGCSLLVWPNDLGTRNWPVLP